MSQKLSRRAFAKKTVAAGAAVVTRSPSVCSARRGARRQWRRQR